MQNITKKIIKPTWNEWLESTEKFLKERNYTRYNQNYKNEDFAYWKSFYQEDKKIYQIGLLFYDFRKFADRHSSADKISIQFECIILDIDASVRFCICDDLTIEKFEEMANKFYETMKEFYG